MDNGTLHIVERIKAVRAATNCGLKEAKDAVEATSSVGEAITLVRAQNTKMETNSMVVIRAITGGGFTVGTGTADTIFAASNLEEVYNFLKFNLKPFGRN